MVRDAVGHTVAVPEALVEPLEDWQGDGVGLTEGLFDWVGVAVEQPLLEKEPVTLEQGVAVRDAVAHAVGVPDTLEEPEAERQRDAVGLAERLREGDAEAVPQPDAEGERD